MKTIENLMASTGYSKATVHILCTRLNIRATRGKVAGNPGKGTYSEADEKKLLDYKFFLSKQLTSDEAVREVLNGTPT